MRTEELLRYEAEYQAMQEALKTPWLVFEFPQASILCKDDGASLFQKTETSRTFIVEVKDALKKP
jgi:hypothetical protein